MKFIDLFAGIGGFHLGLKRVQDTLNTGKEFTCVYSNEWDKYANAVYKKHFGECDDRDIRTIEASEIPDHELLCAGFPCQAFSVAGKREGFSDIRGTLFFEIARIAKEKRPRYLLLENVKGLLNHEQGRTFATILTTLDELGYDLQWQVCNSKNFGVPQNRERVYIVGHLRETPRPKVFPIIRARKSSLKQVGNVDTKGHNSIWGRVYSPEGISSTLNAHGGGLGAKTGLYAMQWRRTEKGKQARREAKKNGKDYTPFNDGNRELVPKPGKPIGTLTAQAIAKDSLVWHDSAVRRLTPVECERLQGFPDDWTKFGVFDEYIDLMSDTQRYKMTGNAVTTNVITHIGKLL